MKLVECVPNFSVGRDRAVIDAIGRAAASVPGIRLLDVDPGADTNRTVYTFVGPIDRIVDGAFEAIRTGVGLIDMSKHSGAHARQGACDVCPFVPIGETTMEECVALAHALAKRVGEELEIPVYLYEYAATRPERRSIVDIREGEYEALPEKLKEPKWAPDYGPAKFNAKAGATVIGAREFLIAYNINLTTKNAKIAKDIALTIRDSGRPLRDSVGKKVKGDGGRIETIPGMFQFCKATGWYIPAYGCAQVTMNLTNYRVTPPHVVFDAVCKLAEERGVRVTGSEIVGLTPLEVLRMAGEHYQARQGASRGVTTDALIDVAVRGLGLKDVAPFEPARKVVEFRTRDKNAGLMGMTVNAFTDELSSDSPAPGGGSVAALCGALSAALSSMVAALTFAKKGFEGAKEQMDDVGRRGQRLKEFFAQAVDDDTQAFNRVMDAMRLPKVTQEEKAARAAAIQAATRQAVLVPFSVLERSAEAVALAEEMIDRGNPNSLSDAGVAALCAKVAATGAYYNVMINLPGITDRQFVDATEQRAAGMVARVCSKANELHARVQARLYKEIGKAEK